MPAQAREAPAQAREAVAAVIGGDRGAMRAALSPPLASMLPTDLPPSTRSTEPVDVTMTEWFERDRFATGTAVVHQADAQVELQVGFRLVEGSWRITFVEPRST